MTSNNEISMQDFNDNFAIHIRSIEKDHTDETGVHPYGVGFNVICTTNRRCMFFEAHLTSNQIPEGALEVDIANIAWSNLLPDVKTWSKTALGAESLIGSSYIPSLDFASNPNPSIDLETYNSNFTTKVSRFEVYPQTSPNSWCVGFNVNKNTCSNNNAYFDTNIQVSTFAETRAETEILDMGWSNLRGAFGAWASTKDAEPVMLNTSFTSSNW
jgi:hypothetical protein